MKDYYMKSPDDLDLFSERQVQITQVMEQNGVSGQKVADVLGSKAMEGVCVATAILMSHMSFEMWQRAAFEMYAHTQKGDDPAAASCAVKIWMLVEYIQACRRQSLDDAKHNSGIAEIIRREFRDLNDD